MTILCFVLVAIWQQKIMSGCRCRLQYCCIVEQGSIKPSLLHVLFLKLKGFQSCQTVSVVIGSMGLGTKNCCAHEGQQQFSSQSVLFWNNLLRPVAEHKMTDVTTEQAVMVQNLPKIPFNIYTEHSFPDSVPIQLMLCLLMHTMAKTFGNGVSSLFFLWSFLSCMDEIHIFTIPNLSSTLQSWFTSFTKQNEKSVIVFSTVHYRHHTVMIISPFSLMISDYFSAVMVAGSISVWTNFIHSIRKKNLTSVWAQIR